MNAALSAPWRTLAVVVLCCIAVGACSEEATTPLVLSFQAQSSVEPAPDRILIWLKKEEDGTGGKREVFFEAESVPFSGRDLSKDPVRVELDPKSNMRGEVQIYAVAVSERGASDDRWNLGPPVWVAIHRVTLPTAGTQTVVLEPFETVCDQDGDYFHACRDPLCCPGFVADAPFVDCLDVDGSPAARESHPFRSEDADICGNGVDEDCNGELARCDVDDMDQDGAPASVDCDDNDAARYPDALEVCGNGIDEDCDGSDMICDRDNDGFSELEDCNDRDPLVFPGANEQFCDGRDDNCNGRIDEDLNCDDFDRDGRPNDEDCQNADSDGEGLEGRFDSGRSENLDERCGDGIDQDCDNIVDEGCPTADEGDADLDGFIDVRLGGRDCDDSNPFIYPGAPEVCSDGIDQDCQSGDWPCANDTDGDGFDDGADCNNSDPSIHPNALGDVVHEICDGRDQDCDGLIDEGNPRVLVAGASPEPLRCGTNTGECSLGWHVCTIDVIGMVYISCLESVREQTEICDGERDEDCDARVDEGFDQDNDGVTSCGGDCADRNPDRNDQLSEDCDGIDNDCDNTIDEGALNSCDGCGPLDHAEGANCGECGTWVCDTRTSLRCDDPGANACEGCMPLSNMPNTACGDCGTWECSGQNDVICDDQGEREYWNDRDEDTYGRGPSEMRCGPMGDRTATRGGDCDDRNPDINPDATEVCDSKDNNCSEGVDEGDLCPDSQVCDDGSCLCAGESCGEEDEICCDEDEECCGEACCPDGQCCGDTCCGDGQACCGDTCCGDGQTCCDGACCDGACCDGECCGDGEACCSRGPGMPQCRPEDDCSE